MKRSFSSPFRTFTWAIMAGLLAFGLWAYSFVKEQPRILVFSKTAAFRHSSIGAGQKAFFALG